MMRRVMVLLSQTMRKQRSLPSLKRLQPLLKSRRSRLPSAVPAPRLPCMMRKPRALLSSMRKRRALLPSMRKLKSRRSLFATRDTNVAYRKKLRSFITQYGAQLIGVDCDAKTAASYCVEEVCSIGSPMLLKQAETLASEWDETRSSAFRDSVVSGVHEFIGRARLALWEAHIVGCSQARRSGHSAVCEKHQVAWAMRRPAESRHALHRAASLFNILVFLRRTRYRAVRLARQGHAACQNRLEAVRVARKTHALL